MKLITALTAALCLPSATLAARMGKASKPSSADMAGSSSVTFTLTNLHPYHHFGFWFTMVHDSSVGPIFTPNMPAVEGLEQLCETGVPDELVAHFSGMPGVQSAVGTVGALFGEGWAGSNPTGAGDSNVGTLDIQVEYPGEMLVTIVAMIANSNDGCIILDGVTANGGEEYTFTEVDIGTEANMETCGTIGGCGQLPGGMGPLCPCGDEGNSDATQPAGEGFMTAHTGLGKRNGGLLVDSDWRQPMVTAVVSGPSIRAEIA